MITLAVVSLKGGVGKTTVATNLAAAAHLHGRRTLLVDLDQQGAALNWRVARADGSRLAGLVVVKYDRPLTLSALREMANGFDVVVLDGPPQLGRVTQTAAAVADIVVVPVSTGPYDTWATDQTLPALDDAAAVRHELGLRPSRRVFLMSSVEVGGVLTRQLSDLLQQEKSGELLPASVYQRLAYKYSALEGESVLSGNYDPLAAREFEQVYAALLNPQGARSAKKR